jgi:hypothetical protein
MRFSGMLEPPNCGKACSVAFVPQRARSRYASPLVFAKACELGLEGSSRSALAADIRAETAANGWPPRPVFICQSSVFSSQSRASAFVRE